jgi:hypothetical protein
MSLEGHEALPARSEIRLRPCLPMTDEDSPGFSTGIPEPAVLGVPRDIIF